MRRLLILLLCTFACLNAAPAFAGITGIAASPAAVNVPSTRSATVTLTWTVVVNAEGTQAVRSNEVEITSVGGNILYGTVPLTFAHTMAPATGASFTETVRIPFNILRVMARADVRSFWIARHFTSTSTTSAFAYVTATLVGGGGSGALAIDRVALTFDDLSTSRLVQKGEHLTAIARISASGGGMLRGRWEIADPTSTIGEPVFRPLREIHQTLVGSQETRLVSPPLPTRDAGMHLLRLTIDSPSTSFPPQVIRYFVNADTAHAAPTNIELGSPGNDALIGTETEFAWRTLPNARAFLLEIYRRTPRTADLHLPRLGSDGNAPPEPAKVEGPPETGMLLLGATDHARLSQLVWGHLTPGQAYWWRVVAIGTDGGVIGVSGYRGFHTR